MGDQTAAADAMRQPRPPSPRGDRIDAAMDHLAQYGFSRSQIRNVIKELLQVYGNGRDGWALLEEGSYDVVLNKLLEEPAQQDQGILEHSRFTPSAINRRIRTTAAEAMRRPRYQALRRMDYAIDHLAEYGFTRPQIRKAIRDLLQLYRKDGWPLLEDGSYRVVLDKLLEEQVLEDQDDDDGSTITVA